MKRKNMKIRVDDNNRQQIRDALDGEQYNLAGVSNYAPYYYTYDNTPDVYYGNIESAFNECQNVEHFLISDARGSRFVTVDEYYVYPTTPYSEDKTTYEPLPEEQNVPSITPRVEFLRQRVSEILAAMTRFNELKMVPPNEWHEELEETFMEIRTHA